MSIDNKDLKKECEYVTNKEIMKNCLCKLETEYNEKIEALRREFTHEIFTLKQIIDKNNC